MVGQGTTSILRRRDSHVCPLAQLGMASELTAACPGFSRVDVRFDDGPGQGLEGVTCSHIGVGWGGRGFAPVCQHPEAERVIEAARSVSLMLRDRAAVRARRHRPPRQPRP